MSNITKCGNCGAPVRFGHSEEDCETIKELRAVLVLKEELLLKGAQRIAKAERELVATQARLKSLVATYERGE